MGIITLVLFYCFLADRTQIFNKTKKHFYLHEFLVLGAIVLVLGVFSIRRSAAKNIPVRHTPVEQPVADQPFLSRDQTDEWKGWMQFAILIYHYTGASSVLRIYQVIRILVASYLFMTGFGHTLFFYQKQDYSLKRCASVLVRLNLLSCLLPYVMGTDYLYYYFAPLVSFWYMVVFLTLRICKSRNTSTLFLLGKVAVSAAMVTSLIRVPTLLEKIFLLLQHMCQIKWNVKEWRFRLQLDSYIVYIGLLAAIFYRKILDILHAQRFPSHNRISLIRRHWGKIRILSVMIASAIFSGFWIFARYSTNKFVYNRWVPYISPFPIISFIILRNSNSYFRNYYSSIFAWLGRCSLETFTLQFHIWLAADTKGLLSLGVFGRRETHIDGRYHDLAILTVVFLWLSWLTADATATITTWIIDPKRPKVVNGPETAALPTKRFELESMINATGSRPLHAGALSKLAKRVHTMWIERLEIRLCSILLILWIMNMAKT